MKLPVKIEPCPIIDTVIELRLERKESIPQSAVFGIVFNALQKKFPSVKGLPILELPEPIRINDPNLKYAPQYISSKDNINLNIGPNVISVGCQPPYVGWPKLFSEIKETFDIIHSTDVFEKVSRVSIRVVDFFESNIFNNINLKINLLESVITPNNTIFKTVLTEGEVNTILQIASDVNLKTADGRELFGSVVDIDSFYLAREEENLKVNGVFDRIDEVHNVEKKLFYALINKDFLESNFTVTYETEE